jgi:hypothetical protein
MPAPIAGIAFFAAQVPAPLQSPPPKNLPSQKFVRIALNLDAHGVA